MLSSHVWKWYKIHSNHCFHSSSFRLCSIECFFTCWLNKTNFKHELQQNFYSEIRVSVLLKHVTEQIKSSQSNSIQFQSVYVCGWPHSSYSLIIFISSNKPLLIHRFESSGRNLDVNRMCNKQYEQPAYVNGRKSSTCLYACYCCTCAASVGWIKMPFSACIICEP